MTKERLGQLKYIEKSLKIVKDDIRELNMQLANSVERNDIDKAKYSMAETLSMEKHLQRSGVDYSAYYKLKAKLEQKAAELQERLFELEDWLEEIGDEKLYLIFRLKYWEGMTYGQIGAAIGYHRTRVSQLHDEYLRMSK